MSYLYLDIRSSVKRRSDTNELPFSHFTFNMIFFPLLVVLEKISKLLLENYTFLSVLALPSSN